MIERIKESRWSQIATAAAAGKVVLVVSEGYLTPTPGALACVVIPGSLAASLPGLGLDELGMTSDGTPPTLRGFHAEDATAA